MNQITRTSSYRTHSVARLDHSDGSILLSSNYPLGDYAQSTGEWLHHWAEIEADRVFIAERSGDGWREETYTTTLQRDGGITLGPEIQNLARATALETRERFRPIMHAIRETTGETVDLAILEGNRMRFLDQVVGSQRLRTVSSIGETFSLTSTANGKAALACLSPTIANALISAELTADVAGKRIRKRLLAELKDIQNGALAKDEDEHTEGVSALGFAITDNSGDVYALSTPVPSSRYARVKDFLEKVIAEQRDKITVDQTAG